MVVVSERPRMSMDLGFCFNWGGGCVGGARVSWILSLLVNLNPNSWY